MIRKKIMLTAVCITLLSMLSIGQSTTATNVIGVGRFLGFTGAQDLQFRTNNVTRMTLTQATGRLGLGIAAPTSIFHISTTAIGDVFKSDGPTASDNRWQLLTSGTERFRIRTLANGFDTYLERTQAGSEADLRLLTAEVQLRARNKRLGAFCELAGETLADVVQFGDNTNVNIFNHAQTIALVPRGTSWWGTSGTMRSGQFYMIHAPQNVQVDAIIPDVPQNGIGNLHNGDVYFQGRCASDTLTYIRMQNGTLMNGVSVPALIGYNNSNSNHGLAISGKINPTNDIVNINGPAVVEIDGRIGDNVVADNVVANRMLFRVCNFNVAQMSMEAGGQLGLRTNTPGNRLEIKSILDDPYFGNAAGSSGLRFTNLTSANTPLTNPSSGVLSVDANGDVIYVRANDCRWLDFPFGIATGFASTPCNIQNVGIGIQPDVKVKLDVLTTGITNIAIRGIANTFNSTGGVFSGTALDASFVGNVIVAGDLTATTLIQSDNNLKENVQEMGCALDMIGNLNLKSYNYKCNEFPDLNLPAGEHCGVIAQEIQQVLPGLVKEVTKPEYTNTDGTIISPERTFLAVNYTELVPIALKGIQELQAQVELLQQQLAQCCNSNQDNRRLNNNESNSQHVQLSNASIILNQNVPNPFAEQTTIKYNITEDFTKAQILFYDANGKLIQSTDITLKGEGQLNVFADDLTSGTYSYALVVDGKVIETKKMLKL
jgi:hypothetical protein